MIVKTLPMVSIHSSRQNVTRGLTRDMIILHPQHPHDRGGEQPARHGRGNRAHQEVGGHNRLYI